MDEVHTFIGTKKKPIWIVLALERSSGRIVDFYLGPRTRKSLRMVVNTLLLAEAEKIFTDGLTHYRGLVRTEIHTVQRYGTNRIERFNLSLRLHLKRLNRRTIAFSRSNRLLWSCIIIYLWGEK